MKGGMIAEAGGEIALHLSSVGQDDTFELYKSPFHFHHETPEN